jgi:hypothetical protein
MNPQCPSLFLILALLLQTVTGGTDGAQVPENKGVRTPVNEAQLRQAICLAAGFLNRMCGQDGKFVYRVNLDPSVELKPRYNILRHAGTVYALAMAEQAYPGQETRATLKRAAGYLTREAIAPLPGQEDLLAVWSYPEVSGADEPKQARLGGTGLGLVALLSVENVFPGTTPLEELRELGRFLVFMQKEDGSFYSKFMPGDQGRDDRWTSLYYPGEAALGLAMLYEKDPSPVWVRAAAKAIGYLARDRKGKDSVEPDHWALLATARLLPHYERSGQPVPREDIVRHAAQVCESMLGSMAKHPEDALARGCFTSDGRTCPTATRLEGLLAALTFLPEANESLRKRIEAAATPGVAFLVRSLVSSGQHAGGIPRAIAPLPKNHPEFTESFNRRAAEIRIDYVQHAMSAMIQYETLLSSHGREKAPDGPPGTR